MSGTRAGAALTLALVAVAALLAGPGSAATGAPTPSGAPSGAPAVTVHVSELLPRAPRAGDLLEITGELRSHGSETLRGVQVRVKVGPRLATRGALGRADTVPPVYRSSFVTELPELAPDGSTPLSLQVPVNDLPLAAAGVYPLQLEVRGPSGRSGTRQSLGTVSTYLPWFGSAPLDPLRIAVLWPLVDEPRRGPDEVMVDDQLASSFAADGRLGRSLAAARTLGGAVPVTYALDPDLLYTADAMTRPYLVRSGAGTEPGLGGTAAAAWLGALKTAGGDVLALPFADPDVVALTRGSAELAADVPAARAYGETVARAVLGRQPLQGVALPPAGRLGDTGLDAVTTGGASAVVLSEEAVSGVEAGRTATPSTRVGLPPSSTSGPVTGLVVDRTLSALLVPASQPDGPRIAEQRWLAETAMIAAELPGRGRTLVVALPHRAAVDPALVAPALTDLARTPWMCPVSLASVVATQERCPGAAVPSYAPDRTGALLQPDARTVTLSPDLVAAVTDVRAAAGQLTGSVIEGGTEQSQALRAGMQRAWLRGESSAWREDRNAGLRLTRLLSRSVGDLRSKVSVVTGSITLTSNTGRVSVLVVNALDQPVTVSVRLQASSDARLSRSQSDLLVVQPHNSLPVQVDARTSTSGRFVVKAQLLDRDGAAFGEPKDLLVRSTRYGAVALAVTGLGAAVLLVAAGVRLVRRALPRLSRR